MAYKQEIEVVPGEVQLISFLVSNPYPRSKIFRIVIEDQDKNSLNYEEMKLVHNDNGEWDYWYSQRKCQCPQSFDIIDSEGRVHLSPGQQVPLLFKFQTFREPKHKANDKNEHAQFIEKRKVIDQLDSFSERNINLKQMSDDNVLVSGLQVRVIPRQQFYDQTFRFYEPERQKVTINVPQFMMFNLQGMTIKSSNKNIAVELNNKSEIILLNQTEMAPRVQIGYIYIYKDSFQSVLLATCRVEIHSMLYIPLELKAEQSKAQQLLIESKTERTCQIFTSNPSLIHNPGNRAHNRKRLMAQKKNQTMEIVVKATSGGKQRAVVSCVDINAREVVQQWLIELEVDKPNIPKIFNVNAIVNRKKFYKFPYQNPLDKDVKVKFHSAKEHYLKIQDTKRKWFHIKPYETIKIDVMIPDQQMTGVKEAPIFVQDDDKDGLINETILIKINVDNASSVQIDPTQSANKYEPVQPSKKTTTQEVKTSLTKSLPDPQEKLKEAAKVREQQKQSANKVKEEGESKRSSSQAKKKEDEAKPQEESSQKSVKQLTQFFESKIDEQKKQANIKEDPSKKLAAIPMDKSEKKPNSSEAKLSAKEQQQEEGKDPEKSKALPKEGDKAKPAVEIKQALKKDSKKEESSGGKDKQAPAAKESSSDTKKEDANKHSQRKEESKDTAKQQKTENA